MNNVIVVGCGRVGSRLATKLSENGDTVSVIDKSPDSFANLGDQFDGRMVQGVGFDEEILETAGIENCDIFTAVTSDDNTNLMCVEVARRLYHVPHVVARLYNAEHERAYNQLGIDFVCGTTLVAEEIFSKAASGHNAYLDSFGEFEILEFSLNLANEDNKKSIRVGDMEKGHDVRIIAFERADGSASSIPSKDSVLYQGDTVLACVRHDLVERFSRFMQA